jgi:hypothetical protein
MARKTPAKRNTRLHIMAPYFVQQREFERRLIRDAYAAAGEDLETCAAILGVYPHYIKARAKLLGAVFGQEPKHEPPGLALDAWNATARSGRDRKHQSERTPDDRERDAEPVDERLHDAVEPGEGG